MGKASLKARLIVPLMAFVFALAFAPAAFAADLAPANDGDTPTVPELKNAQVTFTGGTSYVYTGRPVTPAITVTLDGKTLQENVDYWKFYDENNDVGPAEVWVYNDLNAASGEEVKYQIAEFTITAASIKNANIKLANEVYTGKKIKPLPLITYNGITLKKGVDYTLAYGKNKKVGKGKVVITGKGNFVGKVTKKFKITKASLKDANISSVKDKVYTGNWIRPNVKVKFNGKKLKKGRDYTVKYTKNKNVGVAKIKVKGKGNFKGTRTVQFAITPRPITDCNAYLNSKPYWTGSPVEPAVKATYKGRTLDEGSDYVLHYHHGMNSSLVGFVDKVTIYGKGNFKGTRAIQYTVAVRPITNSSISVGAIGSLKLSDPNAFPTVYFNNGYRTYQLQSAEYTLSWGANNKVGKNAGVVYITGTGYHFSGTRTVKYDLTNG